MSDPTEEAQEPRAFAEITSAGRVPRSVPVAVEAPLGILIDGEPFLTSLATPGEEVALVAGRLLTEGVIDSRGDLGTIDPCTVAGRRQVRVTLGERASHAWTQRRAQEAAAAGSGTTLLSEVSRRIRRAPPEVRVTRSGLRTQLAYLSAHQALREATHGTHAVALFDAAGTPLALAEDVGRHNAFDKALGRLLLDGRLAEAVVAVASSRASFEMAQKAAVSGLAVLATVSAPTTLAIRLAELAGFTLACFGPEGSVGIFAGEERFAAEP